jgi:hypothetical protein
VEIAPENKKKNYKPQFEINEKGNVYKKIQHQQDLVGKVKKGTHPFSVPRSFLASPDM